MKLIPLTQGKVTKVDAVDYPELARHSWWLDYHSETQQYAMRQVGRKTIRMHVQLLGKRRKFEVDHINGDGLDNRRRNLRYATRQQQTHNSRRKRTDSCPYKGITYQKRLKRCPWQARISYNGHQNHLGYFATAVQAAIVYNHAAKNFFGAFAALNTIKAVK